MQRDLGDYMSRGTGHMKAQKKTIKGLHIVFRPATHEDDKPLKKFFESLSSDSMINRFTTSRVDFELAGIPAMTHFDPLKEMVIIS